MNSLLLRWRVLSRLAAGLLLQLLSPVPTSFAAAPSSDWLVDPAPFVSKVTPSADGREVELNNGLVRRVLRLKPNAATVDFDNLMTGESLLRAVRPEARVELDGTPYNVGGLTGQPVHNYLDAAWLDKLEAEQIGRASCRERVSSPV